MIENMKTKKECLACNTPIWKVDGSKLKKTSEYSEVEVKVSNGSNMTAGVCKSHTEPSKDDLATMTHKLHQGWLEELAFGLGNKEWVENHGLKLKITGAK